MKWLLVVLGFLMPNPASGQQADTSFASIDEAEAVFLLKVTGGVTQDIFVRELAPRSADERTMPRNISRMAALGGNYPVKSDVPAVCRPQCDPEVFRDLKPGQAIVLIGPRRQLNDSTIGVVFQTVVRKEKGTKFTGSWSVKYLRRGNSWIEVGYLRRMH